MENSLSCGLIDTRYRVRIEVILLIFMLKSELSVESRSFIVSKLTPNTDQLPYLTLRCRTADSCVI
jgi:hypothetical protein